MDAFIVVVRGNDNPEDSRRALHEVLMRGQAATMDIFDNVKLGNNPCMTFQALPEISIGPHVTSIDYVEDVDIDGSKPSSAARAVEAAVNEAVKKKSEGVMPARAVMAKEGEAIFHAIISKCQHYEHTEGKHAAKLFITPWQEVRMEVYLNQFGQSGVREHCTHIMGVPLQYGSSLFAIGD